MTETSTPSPRGKPLVDPLQVVAIIAYALFTILSGVLHLPLLPNLASKLAVGLAMLCIDVVSVALYVVCALPTDLDTTEDILEADRKARDTAMLRRKSLEERRRNGEVTEESPEDIAMPTPTIRDVDVRYCLRCERDVHYNTKHCMVCNRCCARFDHHCKWLNNCVGGQNYTAFVWFVTVSLFGVVAYTALGAYHIVQYAVDDETMKIALHNTFNSGESGPAHIIVISIMCVVELLGIVAVGLLAHLLIIHIYLIRRGITTYAWILEKRATQTEEQEERERLGIAPGLCDDSCHTCLVESHRRKQEAIAKASDERSYTPGGDGATYTTPEGFDNSLANVLDLDMVGARSEMVEVTPHRDYTVLVSDTPTGAAEAVREQHPDKPQDLVSGDAFSPPHAAQRPSSRMSSSTASTSKNVENFGRPNY